MLPFWLLSMSHIGLGSLGENWRNRVMDNQLRNGVQGEI
jgi:hypothetical protein